MDTGRQQDENLAVSVLVDIADGGLRAAVTQAISARPGFEVFDLSTRYKTELCVFGATRAQVGILQARGGATPAAERLRMIGTCFSHARILLLTDESWTTDALAELLPYGLGGLLPEESPLQDYLAAIEALRRGQHWLSRDLHSALLHRMVEGVRVRIGTATRPLDRPRFSPREQEIVDLLATGCGDKEIARRLGVQPSTIRTVIRRLFDKLGVRRRSALTRYAGSPPEHLAAGPRDEHTLHE